jgi:hypothetical protein
VYLWTHYYDPALCGPVGSRRFPSAATAEYQGFRHTVYRQEYLHLLQHEGFCGGSATFSTWLTREDILGALRHFGFQRIETGFEEVHHAGPSFSVVALRD